MEHSRPNIALIAFHMRDEIQAVYKEMLLLYVRFEVFTAVSLKNAIFWDVAPCVSCKYRSFGET
jgi:hypothetical protein